MTCSTLIQVFAICHSYNQKTNDYAPMYAKAYPREESGKVDIPAPQEPPKVIYIAVPQRSQKEENEQQTINYKLKWWHVAIAFVAGYALASSNSKKA